MKRSFRTIESSTLELRCITARSAIPTVVSRA
jgi:hypothetical protein